MRVFKYIFFALLFLVVVFFAYGFLFLDDKVQVTRSITIDRPANKVFKALNTMRHTDQWSPWAQLDPEAEYQYSGPESGVGSQMSWQSNDNLGSGKQTIVEATPNTQIKAELYFDGQGEDPTWTTYLIESSGGSSIVTRNFAADFRGDILRRYFGIMIDGMLGPQYEKDLQKLKTLVENQPTYDFSAVSTENIAAQNVLYISASRSPSEDMDSVLGDAFAQVTDFMNSNDISFDGMPMAITRRRQDSAWYFDAAIPVDLNSLGGETGDIQLGKTYAGNAVKYTQKGAYDPSKTSYALMDAYIEDNDLQRNGNPWKVYANDPASVPESEILTFVYQPVK